jgi:hypothetical protein
MQANCGDLSGLAFAALGWTAEGGASHVEAVSRHSNILPALAWRDVS